METYPIIDEKNSGRPFAFEVENAYVGLKAIARLLREVDGVTDVRPRKLFHKSSDVHIEFKYLNFEYMVWEPFGDNSRYWIGPKNRLMSADDIANIEAAFKRYRPPFYRTFLGDILMLRLCRQRRK